MTYLENIYFDPVRKYYPVTSDNISTYYKNLSVPVDTDESFITFLGLKRVVAEPKPIIKSVADVVVENDPVLINGEYHQNWVVKKLNISQEEQAIKIEELRKKILSELASYRWEKEVNGIIVNGLEILTDRESQAQLASAVMVITQRFANTINWKGRNGWITLYPDQIIAISRFVSQFVQGCFNIEKYHSEQISKLQTVEELMSYDYTTKWGTNVFNY